MRGKAINGVDASTNRNILAENADLLLTVDNTAGESPDGSVANEHNTRIRATEIMLEVVADAAAGAHASASQDDGPAMDVIYCDRFGGLSREIQFWQSKRVASLLK